MRDIFAQRDWNTILGEDGTRHVEVEQILATHVDAPAGPALGALRAGEFPLSDRLRALLANFMAVQLSRGRFPRENLAEAVIKVTRFSLKLAATQYRDEQWRDRTGEVPTAEVRQRVLDNEDHVDIKPTNALLLRALLSGADEIAELLYIRTWTLVRFATPCLFTAENPVIHVTARDDSLGYGAMTTEQMYMPVSPTYGLVLSQPWTSWPEATVSGTPELAARLNWAILVYGSNRELLLDPDVRVHPLPGPALLSQGHRWPWPADPEAEPPAFMHYVVASGRRSPVPPQILDA